MDKLFGYLAQDVTFAAATLPHKHFYQCIIKVFRDLIEIKRPRKPGMKILFSPEIIALNSP
jgi:hypothetical protein